MPIDVPHDMADLLRNPERIKKAFEMLRALENGRVVLDGVTYPIRFSPYNAVVDLGETGFAPTAGVPVELDPETIIWRDRAIAAGGTFLTDSIAIADALIIAIKAASFNSKILWLVPLLSDDLTTARVPLRDTLGVGIMSTTTFTAGDNLQAAGLQGDGTKLCDTHILASQLLAVAGGAGFGWWERAVGTLPWNLASTSTTKLFGLAIWNADELFYFGDATSATRTLAPAGNHHYYGQRLAVDDRKLYRNGSEIAATTTTPVETGTAAANIFLMAVSVTTISEGRCGVAYLTDGTMNAGEILAFHNLLQTYLITPTGR